MNPTPEELGLAEQATRALARTRRADKNTACAAVLDAEGNTWLGLDLVSRMPSVSAEPAAIAAAHLRRAHDLTAIAAVCYTPDLETTAPTPHAEPAENPSGATPPKPECSCPPAPNPSPRP